MAENEEGIVLPISTKVRGIDDVVTLNKTLMKLLDITGSLTPNLTQLQKSLSGGQHKSGVLEQLLSLSKTNFNFLNKHMDFGKLGKNITSEIQTALRKQAPIQVKFAIDHKTFSNIENVLSNATYNAFKKGVEKTVTKSSILRNMPKSMLDKNLTYKTASQINKRLSLQKLATQDAWSSETVIQNVLASRRARANTGFANSYSERMRGIAKAFDVSPLTQELVDSIFSEENLRKAYHSNIEKNLKNSILARANSGFARASQNWSKIEQQALFDPKRARDEYFAENYASRDYRNIAHGILDKNLGQTVGERISALYQKKGDIAKSVGGQFGTRVLNLAQYHVANKVLTTLASSFSSVTENAIRMEDAFSRTQAVAGITNGTMMDLSESILSVGKQSRFATEQIAETATVLAQAGYSADEITNVLGSVDKLAVATGTDLKTSVDVLTSVMSVWNKQSTESEKVVDALTAAVNESKAEITSLQNGIQYAGAAAAQMGVSFEETTAAMAAVTNAGIKARGSIGTGFRALATELTKPTARMEKELAKVGLTFDDVNIRSKGFVNVVRTMKEAGFDAERAFKGLERRAATFYLALSSQLDAYERIRDSMEEMGTATKAQEARMNTFAGQIQRLKNILLSITTQVGEPFVDFLKNILKGINSLLEVLSKLTEGFSKAYHSMLQFFSIEYKLEKTEGALSQTEQTISSLIDNIFEYAQKQNDLTKGSKELNKATFDLSQKFEKAKDSVKGVVDEYKDLLKVQADVLIQEQKQKREKLGEKLKYNDLQIKNERISVKRDFRRFSRMVKPQFSKEVLSSLGSSSSDELLSMMIKAVNQGDLKSLITFRNVLNSNGAVSSGNRGFRGNVLDYAPNLNKTISLYGERDRLRSEMLSSVSGESEEEIEEVVIDVGDFVKQQQTKLSEATGLNKSQTVESATKLASFINEIDNTLSTLKENTYSDKALTEINNKKIEIAVNTRASLLELLKEVAEKALKDSRFETKIEDALVAQRRGKDGTKPLKSAISSQKGQVSSLENFLNVIMGMKDMEEISEKVKVILEKEKGNIAKASEKLWTMIVESIKNGLEKNKSVEAKLKTISKEIEDTNSIYERKRNELSYSYQAERKYGLLAGGMPESRSRVANLRDELLGTAKKQNQSEIERIASVYVKTQEQFNIAKKQESDLISALQTLEEEIKKNTDVNDETKKADKQRLESDLEIWKQKVTDYDLKLQELQRQGVDLSGRNILAEEAEKEQTMFNGAKSGYDQFVLETIKAADAFKSFSETTYSVLTDLKSGLSETIWSIVRNGQEAGQAFRSLAISILDSIGQKTLNMAIDNFISGLLEGSISDGILTTTTTLATSALQAFTSAVLAATAALGVKSGTSVFGEILGTVGSATAGSLLGGAGAGGSSLGGGRTGVATIGSSYFGQGFSTGGIVRGQNVGHDNVPAMLSAGEFVMKKSAVDVLGTDVLNKLNNATSSSASSTSGVLSDNNKSKNTAPVLTNVYVVSQDEARSLTPEDVVIEISKDILRGGQTRQLIKQVVAGRY